MVNDERYWDITTYYLVFTVLNLGLTYMVYRVWRDHVRTWRVQESRWQIALLLLAAVLILFATAVNALLYYVTYAAWRTALNPDSPAPLVELAWIFGIFAVSLPAAFAGMLQTFIRKEFDELMP